MSEADAMARLAEKMERLTGVSNSPPSPPSSPQPGLPQREAQAPAPEDTAGTGSPDEPGPEGEGAPDTFDLEYGGEKFTLPAKLKDAFLREQDYTRKTQALGDQQRALDQARETLTRTQAEQVFRQSIDTEMRELAVIDAYLTEATKLNWSQMGMEQMFRARAEMDQVKDRRAALEKTVAEKREKFSQDMDARLKELRQKSRELAAKSIPNYSEETEAAIRKYAGARGLSDGEIDNVLLDPRSARILWEGAQFEKVKTGASKVPDAIKALRPGASNERMPQQVVDKLNLRKALAKAPNSGAKARLIEDSLLRRFEKR